MSTSFDLDCKCCFATVFFKNGAVRQEIIDLMS